MVVVMVGKQKILPSTMLMHYGKELLYVAMSTLAWAAVHRSLTAHVLRPVADRLVKRLPVSLRDARKQKLERLRRDGQGGKLSFFEEMTTLKHKFETALWKCITYTLLATMGWWVLTRAVQPTWIWDVASYHRSDQTAALKWMYVVELGYYLYGMWAIWEEPKSKDRPQMLLHHVATVALISTSYVGDKMRFGTSIMWLHDVADPWLELSKLALYTDVQWLPTLAFPIFAGVFIFTRNYLLPVKIIWRGVVPLKHTYSLWWPTFLALSTLSVLHVIWAAMILKVLWQTQVQGQKTGDIREEE